ncbi:rhodanese-like domain-containing protein [Methylorubrum sp. SB2]|uniref:rhodanese-like domain-containing protein n=1 Tax=Methylorubrum subtropicum TaxID=3138812 RepID=UPI00313E1E1A
MRPVLRLPIVTAAAVFLTAAAPADSPVGVREPDGYWQGALHGYTPQTLAGATVVDAGEVAKLIQEHKPVLLDVSEIDRKPAGLPPGGLWFPIYRNIPGSTWLPGSGEGDLDAAAQDALKARVADLTGGDLERPIVTYCHSDCWGSWNLGKRLVALGYRKVHWFPQGIEGWQDGHDTAVSRPDARWAARPKSTVGQ